MNKALFYIVFLLHCQLVAVIPTCELAQALVTPDHQPSELIKKIARLTKIEGDKIDLRKLIEVTQALWRRPPNTERDAIKPMFVEEAKELKDLFGAVGLTTPIMPKAQEYIYAFIHGSIARTMLARFNFLEELVASNRVKIQKLILLTGKRIIGIADEHEREFIKQYIKDDASLTTESDIAKALLLQTDLFPHLKKIYTASTDSKAAVGNNRPQTIDTVKDWLATNPQPGRALAISTTPFAIHQDLAFRTVLPGSFTLETGGPIDPRLMNEDAFIGLCLDSLARTLYQYDQWLAELRKLPIQEKIKS